jgi:hypothetical protein
VEMDAIAGDGAAGIREPRVRDYGRAS